MQTFTGAGFYTDVDKFHKQDFSDIEKAKAAWQTVVALDPKTEWAKDAQSMLQQHLSGSAQPSASDTPSSSASQ